MSKSQKPKSGKTRNDDRPNGKAFKKNPGRSGGLGSRRTRYSEEGRKQAQFDALLVLHDKLNREEKLKAKARARKNKDGEDD